MVKQRSGGRKFIFEATVLTLMALGLTSCGRSSLAPVFHGNHHSVNEDGGARARADGQAYQVSVRNGDTLSEIALRHHVPTRQLARANGIRAPFTIMTGQELTIPATPNHRVQRGESLSVIAQRYQVETRDLARANNIRRPYTIYAGQQLDLPWASSPATSSVSNNASRPARDRRVNTRSATQHASATTRAARPAPRPRAAPTSAASRRVSPQPATVASARSLIAPPRSGDGFMWPVNGTILTEYGPTNGGQHNDGINIAIPSGTPILAADAGVVIYQGNEVPGYGGLILIRHENGFVTAYAHSSRIHVRQGQVVDRGERIGLSGRSGRVSEPQLHFEVRRNSEAVNPAQFLAGA